MERNTFNHRKTQPVDFTKIHTHNFWKRTNFGPNGPVDQTPTGVHLFLFRGEPYDKTAFVPPARNLVRYVFSDELLESSDDPMLNEILALVQSKIPVTLDISCCGWIDQQQAPAIVKQFIDFVLSCDGTVRFSDFALRVAKEYLNSTGFDVDYTLVSDISGKTKLKFDASDLAKVALQDLNILSELAQSGEITVRAMSGTRRMSQARFPDYAKVLMRVGTDPALVLLEHPQYRGKIILSSCHFVEMVHVRDADPERVMAAVRMTQGNDAANRFMAEFQSISASCGADAGDMFIGNQVGAILSASDSGPSMSYVPPPPPFLPLSCGLGLTPEQLQAMIPTTDAGQK